MRDEILINVTPRETRVAIVENGLLQEVHIERASRRGLVGNIYKGRVSRVLPGIQAAFIEVGLERTAFLHAADIVPGANTSALIVEAEESRRQPEEIDRLVHEGQEVLVQVIKDPLGTKGARLTTQLSLPSRYVVYMPAMDNIGVSQKIEDEQERQRLRDVVADEVDGDGGGYILRTAAEGASEYDLREDVSFLHKLWLQIQGRIAETPAGQRVYEAMPLELRILRDLPLVSIDRVRVDSRETYQRLCEFSEKFIAGLLERIEHYPGERPIFDLYSIDDEIQKALDSKVQLKSGGHLYIDQTESMTTIDVNTGAFIGHRNMEETLFKTNLEASQAIARQLRLRNLGGIIIIDFIDMQEDEHKRQVLRSLEKGMEGDRARHHICEVSPLGLVEMTRERTRESLEHILCESCPVCAGRGSIRTRQTTCYEIFREIIRESRQFEAKQFLVMAAQDVVAALLDDESDSLVELESFIGKSIKLQVEVAYTQEQYDVVML